MPNIRVMHFGLGPDRRRPLLKQIAARPGFKIVGGVDVDPAKVGRDLGDVVGLTRRLGVKVSRRRREGAQGGQAATSSCTARARRSSRCMPQLETILKAKTPIVSTTEELAYPGYTHIRQARQIHALGEEGEGRRARAPASIPGSRWTRCRSR